MSAGFTGCTEGFDEVVGAIYDTSTHSPVDALRDFEAGYGAEGQMVAQRAYARWLTTEEQWELRGRDCWCDQRRDEWLDEGYELGEERTGQQARARFPWPPVEAPEGWEPDPDDEYMPAWEFCAPDAPGASPVWHVLELARTGPAASTDGGAS